MGGRNNRGPVQVIDMNKLINDIGSRKGHFVREVTIEMTPEGITETTRTIDEDGNQTVEVKNGNLSKNGKRANPGEMIHSFDNHIENLIFGLLHGQIGNVIEIDLSKF